MTGGNKMANFYYCAECGNVFTSERKASVNCCGQEWKALEVSANEPNEKHQLDEVKENGKTIYKSHHVQDEGHYFPFMAFESECGCLKIKTFKPGDTVKICVPEGKHGKLYWFCNLHGLYVKEV